MKQLKSVFIIFFVAIAVAAFFWVAKNFGGGESVESEKSAVICFPTGDLPKGDKPQNAPPEQPSSAEATAGRQECFWTAHIHADIKVLQDNKEITLGFEQGELERIHTHAEKDKLHWHGLIPVDSKTKEVTDWSPFSIEQLLKDLGFSIEDGPQVIINDKEVDLSHRWKDGDIIEIRYAK